MKFSQFKDSGWLFSGQLVIKLAGFLKQVLLAFFLGVSADIDLFLVAQIVPAILSSMIAGGAGEVLVTGMKKKNEFSPPAVVYFIVIISLITLLLGGFYLLSVPIWQKIFGITPERAGLFWTLSLVVVANKLPLSLVSVLKHLLFFRKKYRYYIITGLLSEFAGVITILLLVNKTGIMAFAWGLLISSMANALLYFNIHGLSFKYLVSLKQWIQEKQEIIILLKRVFSLSLQTLVNHLSTFWERTLSLRFLEPGYLSALNYSRSLNEMPKTIMLSSILTTTYIEQVNHKTESEGAFKTYTGKMESLLSQLSFAFQILSVVFAPLVLIFLFRRGKFDNEAVSYTLIIYQILTIGFIPGLMLNFLSRTMYILGRFRQLFFFILAKTIIEVSLMLLLINKVQHAIPVSLVAGKLILLFILFFYIYRVVPGMFKMKNFLILNFSAILITVAVLFINQAILGWLMDKSNLDIALLYLPVVLACFLLFLFFLHKKGVLNGLIRKTPLKTFLSNYEENQD